MRWVNLARTHLITPRREALWALAGVLAVYLLFGVTWAGRVLDQVAFVGRRASGRGLSDIANAVLVLAGAVGITLGLAGLVFVAYRCGRLTQGIRTAVAVSVTAVTVQVLQRLFPQLPEPVLGALGPAAHSFPSGHVATAAALAMCAPHCMPRPWRPLTRTVSLGAVVVIAAAVLLAGWHRPSEAVAGALLASAVVMGMWPPRSARMLAIPRHTLVAWGLVMLVIVLAAIFTPAAGELPSDGGVGFTVHVASLLWVVITTGGTTVWAIFGQPIDEPVRSHPT